MPRRTSVDELLELIFEQFGTSGSVEDARISRFGRGSVETHGLVMGMSGRTYQSRMHGLIVDQSRRIVHGS